MQEEMMGNFRKLFDDAMEKVGAFRKKTYEEAFRNLYDEYKDLVESLLAFCSESTDGKNLKAAAAVIPEYAQEKMKDASKREQKKLAMDMNLVMAVYVVPMITYTRSQTGDQLAVEMVHLWNERNITGLILSKSSYEAVAQGFHKGLCYITTAVCKDQNKADDCMELTELRRYRDEYLMQSETGRILVEEYYNVAPAIVFAIDMHKDASAIYRDIYQEYLLPCVTYAKDQRNLECKTLYKDMVRKLEQEYLS